jgi:hypothetical protein
MAEVIKSKFFREKQKQKDRAKLMEKIISLTF